MLEKGQMSIEYLALLIALLIAVSGILAYSLFVSQQTIGVQKAQDSASVLARSADQVRALGPGSTIFARINLPEGIKAQVIEGKFVGFVFSYADRNTFVFAESKASVMGDIPLKAGEKTVRVEALPTGGVRLGGGLKIIPDSNYATVPAGSNYSIQFFAWNDTSTKLTGIDSNLLGDANEFASEEGIGGSLDANAKDQFAVNVQVPEGKASGVYSAVLSVGSREGYLGEALVEIFVPQSLKALKVQTFSDDNYDVAQSVFGQGKTIYYAVDSNDQTGIPLDPDDMNSVFTDPTPLDVNTLASQQSSFGRMASAYQLGCNAKQGQWKITSAASAYGTLSAQANFTVLSTDQNNGFGIDWETASEGGSQVKNFTAQNIQGCGTITITGIRVTWSGMPSGTQLDKIKLNGTSRDVSNSGSGQWAGFQGISMNQGESSADNYLDFTKNVSDGATFVVDYNFSDSTVYTSSQFTA